MGIYDRPWYREEPRSARRMPSTNPVTLRLIWVNVGAFLLSILSVAVFRWDPGSQGLGLSPNDVVGKFFVWQLVTSLFLHTGPVHLAFNMLFLWMFGSHVERALGPRRFLRFYFYAGICASLAYAIIGEITAPHGHAYAVGASGSILGIVVWFGMRHPNARVLLFFFIPMRMKWAVLLFVGVDLYGFVIGSGLTGMNIAHTAHLGGALFGFLYFRYAGRFGRFFDRMEKEAESKSRRRRRERDRETQEEVDRLLGKIHEGGIDALTPAERDFLREASKRYGKGGS